MPDPIMPLGTCLATRGCGKPVRHEGGCELAVVTIDVLRDLPDSFWDVAVWHDGGYVYGSIDVADRKRIADILASIFGGTS